MDNNFEVKERLLTNKEYMDIYTTCYTMCTQRPPNNWSDKLYTKHNDTITSYLKKTVLPALEKQHDEFLLTELVTRWTNHLIMNKWMKKFFMYLDRYYVQHHNLKPLLEAGLCAFKKEVYEEVKVDVVTAILAIVAREREGEIVDTSLLKKCVDVFVRNGEGLQCYERDFQAVLLVNTREFYSRKANQWIETDSTPDYMVKAERVIEQEKKRVRSYMHESTLEDLINVVVDELLSKQETKLLHKERSGLKVLLENDKFEDLERMFSLFERVKDGLKPIAVIVQSHIESMGQAVVTKREADINSGEKENREDPVFVKSLLALHDKYTEVVKNQFSGNPLFQRALKDAFVEFVNRNVGKFTNAEMMSTFCDRILKTGGEKLSEKQVEEYLTKIVQLFSFLTDKDLFAEIYRNQLAKRLLNQRSASDDSERLMIGKLKMCCGAQFTSKMEGMLNDLTVGEDHQRAFVESLQNREEPPKSDSLLANFSVNVLTMGYWPTYKSLPVNLPPSLVKCTQVFKEYFDKKTSHRKLHWIHSLGNSSVRGIFVKKNHDLLITTLQCAALFLFNDKDQYSFEDICTSLGLPPDTVKRIMHSLSCGKFKVLKKDPAGKSINVTDSFTFNSTFKSPMRQLRIPMASLEESHNPKRVEEDRSIAIEAAVVRIMKARKTLTHQQLVSEVISQFNIFKPEPKLIKRRIEALIDREYLERDADASNTYRYLA